MIFILIFSLLPTMIFSQYSPEFLQEISYGSTKKMSALIMQQKIDINQIDTNTGYTPLMLALKNGQCHLAITLIEEHNANPNIIAADKETALTIAAYFSQWRAITPLIEHNADIHYTNSNGNALHYSAQHGLSKTVPILIKAGLDVNETNINGQTPLMLAAKNNFLHTIKFLLKNGAKINISDNMGHSALSQAVKNNHLKVVNYLLKNGASILITNTQGDTLVMLAAQNGSTDILKKLIKEGEDIHNANNDGNTALLLATMKNEFQTFKLLLNSKANLMVTNHKGETPYEIASFYEYIDLLKIMDLYLSTNSTTP